jgi:preprotein translocase subunit Sec61beta
MSNNDKVRMPSSGAGITQYFDDTQSSIRLQPMHIVIFAVVVILIELLLWLTL